MKRLPLLITIGIVLVTVGGYFIYERLLVSKNTSPWELVPESTIFVYEANNCQACVQQMQQTSLWSVFRKAAFYQKSADSLKMLFDFIESQPRNLLVSAHQTRKDDFDFVFYVPLYQSKIKNLLLEQWGKLKTDEREFNGVQIHELSSKGQMFSWAEVDDIWVGSFTPFLLEDVIRTYTGDGSTFKNQISSVYQMPHVKEDAGNLYVNIKNFGNWIGSFADVPTDFVQQVGHSSLLDIKADAKALTFNGFSMDSASQGYILSVFNNQVPVPFNMKNYISSRSIMVTSYGISDGAKLGESLKVYTDKKKPSLQDSIAQLETLTGVQVQSLYKTLGKEVSVCYLEGREGNLSKIMLVETTKADEWVNAFNTIAQKTSVDTVFYERFSDYDLREIPLRAFPEKLFWPLLSGFSSSYYTTLGNTVIIGEDVDELKNFLDDIDKEETWGKSVAQNQFLETTLLEANLSIYINTPLAWNMVAASLYPKWKQFVEENQGLLQSLEMGAIQMSHLNNSYYTNITWAAGEAGTGGVLAEGKQDEKRDKLITTFSEGIYKFFVIRNHFTKQEDVLVQDSTRAISLVSADGKVQWKVDLDNYIAGDVAQIDYLKNGKLQFFFATPGKLHVIDRLGNYVKPFPVNIAEKDIEFISVVDYDHSKNYRFLVSGKSGKLWMYDKGGENLDGWKPKSVEGSLFAPAQHHRLRGKDYIVAIREDGVVNLMNRRGESLKNFPLNLDARPVGGYAIESGNDAASTNIVIVSRDGFRIKFNVEGKVVSRESLIKTVPEARFSLVEEEKGKTYLVIRQEPRQLTVMNSDLKEIFGSDFIGNNPAELRYYDFGSGKVYITVTDRSQDLTFIYDGQGKLITAIPLESSAVLVRPSGQSLKVYSGLGRSLTLQPL
ncbi:hypothetical protein ACFQ21_14110 [Ohtaekwangia kribbensis]|uniref:Uncharacterized protein n=1 Tax=Ohtaekwangia kribbensis TaxID=688913 RepID=A0ABW3K2W6_9BACT